MKTTRRQVLRGVIAAPVVAALPTYGPTPQSSISTLESLAIEGKFASVRHELPINWQASDWKFYLDGVRVLEEDCFIREIYAPGDESGWAILYGKKEKWMNTRFVPGNWSFRRVER